MTTPNQLLNELRDEIRKLNIELTDIGTPEWKKLLISNRLRSVGDRLQRLRDEIQEAVK